MPSLDLSGPVEPPYLLWQRNVLPALIPYNLWDNHLIAFQPHLSDL